MYNSKKITVMKKFAVLMVTMLTMTAVPTFGGNLSISVTNNGVYVNVTNHDGPAMGRPLPPPAPDVRKPLPPVPPRDMRKPLPPRHNNHNAKALNHLNKVNHTSSGTHNHSRY